MKAAARIESFAVSFVCPRTLYSSRLSMVLVFILFATNAASVSSNSPLSYQVIEKLPIGTQIGRGLVIDAGLSSLYSSDQLDGLRFSLVLDPTSDVASRHMSILPQSGLLEIKSPIDRDQLCPSLEVCSIKFDVLVVCTGGCFNVISVVVDILDVNDQSPIFIDQSSSVVNLVTITLPESSVLGGQFALPTALDSDSPAFGVQRVDLFPVEARSTFTLLRRRSPTRTSSSSSSLLQLVLAEPLDRELVSQYHLTIVATDGGQPPLSATCSVVVVVSDVNDNDPIFQQSMYSVDVSENATEGTLLTVFRAIDDDIDDNGRVTYHLLSIDDVVDALFAINESTGDLTLKAGGLLDRETTPLYRLTVEARDHGFPVRSAVAVVTVNVVDVNDNPPQVAISTLGEDGRGNVTENAPAGAFVGLVAASDPDVGDNGVTSCHLEQGVNGPLPFELVDFGAATRYKIVSSSPLDREATDEYHLNVVCTDHGSPSLSTTRSIIVLVSDVNDNAPRFRPSSDYRFSVSENSTVGDIIGQLTADDIDVGANARIEYRLIGFGHIDPPFSIDPNTGIMTVNGPIDYESLRLFQFQIEAVDNGRPLLSSIATVTVDVVDVNDIAPAFSKLTYTFSVTENRGGGDVIVGRVEATDPEENANGDIRYTLIDVSFFDGSDGKEGDDNGTTSDGIFIVHPVTGTIMATRPLDRESRSVYRFAVIASDSGHPSLSSSCDVIVRVADANDNSPTIDLSSLSRDEDGTNVTDSDTVVYVSSAARRGRIVARVSASDPDEGENAALSFYISGGAGVESFTIDPSKGVIHVASSDLSALDGRQVSLKVMVVDGGSPPRSASVNLTVVINSSVVLFPVDLAMYVDDDGDTGNVGDDDESFGAAAASLNNAAGRRSRLFSNPNFLIVIAVAAATIIVALALVAAILCVAFRSRWSRYGVARSGNDSSTTASHCRRRGSRGSSGDGGGAFDENLSVFESLTGNDKLVPDECGRNGVSGRLSDALFGSGRCCHDFESFGKTDNMNNEKTMVPLRCTSEVIVINAMPVPEGDRDSASSDSGRGPSEDDFNASCRSASTTAERPPSSSSGYTSKPRGVLVPVSDPTVPLYAGSLHRRPDDNSSNLASSTLFRTSALPRCTSHELALAVNGPPASSAGMSTVQMRTLPTSSSSMLRRPSTHQSGSEIGSCATHRPEVNTRSLRRVTFSNPESVSPPQPKSAASVSPNVAAGYGSSSDAASMTSLTSGSYDIGGCEQDGDENWRHKPVSYIFV